MRGFKHFCLYLWAAWKYKWKQLDLKEKIKGFDWERFLKKRTGRKVYKRLMLIKAGWKRYLAVAVVGLYFYGMILNKITVGITNFKFNRNAPTLVLNPLRNIFAIFTPYGFGATFLFVLMYCFITRKGYNWLSGVKIKRDERGFNVVDEGTHGTSGWMDEREIPRVLDCGKVSEVKNPILGKIKDDADDDDATADYLALKDNNGFNKHILVYDVICLYGHINQCQYYYRRIKHLRHKWVDAITPKKGGINDKAIIPNLKNKVNQNLIKGLILCKI